MLAKEDKVTSAKRLHDLLTSYGDDVVLYPGLRPLSYLTYTESTVTQHNRPVSHHRDKKFFTICYFYLGDELMQEYRIHVRAAVGFLLPCLNPVIKHCSAAELVIGKVNGWRALFCFK